MLKRILSHLANLLSNHSSTDANKAALDELNTLQKGNLDPDEAAAVQTVIDLIQGTHAPRIPEPTVQEPEHPTPIDPVDSTTQAGTPGPDVTESTPEVAPTAEADTTASEEEVTPQGGPAQ